MMSEVKVTNDEQSEVVREVNSAFAIINECIIEVIDKANNINERIQMVNKDKQNVMSALEGMADVLVKTASSTEEVSTAVQQQVICSEELAEQAQKLNSLSQELEKSVSEFNV